jgi:hypothetical protein
MNIYYVYAYLRESDNTPYYIGKGKGNRAFHKSHNVSVPKDRSKIQFIETELTETDAINLEKHYISLYGRKDNETGILRNKTNGGEGTSGLIVTEEKKELNRLSLKIHGEKLWKTAAISNSKKQKQLYENGESIISKGNIEKIQCPYCKKTGQRNAMYRWHFSNCKYR